MLKDLTKTIRSKIPEYINNLQPFQWHLNTIQTALKDVSIHLKGKGIDNEQDIKKVLHKQVIIFHKTLKIKPLQYFAITVSTPFLPSL